MANRKTSYSGQVTQKSKPGEGLNFLERLFALQVMDSTSVPPLKIDNRFRFRIDQLDDEYGICLLFRVDAGYDGLLGDADRRPDYLCLYMRGDICIFTIVELKKGSTREACEQISIFATKLKQYCANYLHGRLQPTIQGIIISPINAATPRLAMERELKVNHLPIRHHMNEKNSDVSNYISNKIDRRAMYEVCDINRGPKQSPRAPNKIESLLRSGVHSTPYLYAPNIKSGQEGLVLKYTLPNENVGCLHVMPTDKVIHFAVQPGCTASEGLRQCIVQAELDDKIVIGDDLVQI